MKNNKMEEFSKLAQSIFSKTLSSFNFKKQSNRTENNYCNIVFVNCRRYIEVNASSDPRDGPAYFNITLGEGSQSFPEGDWNSIALWRLKNLIENNDKGCEYNLESSKNILDLLEQSKRDLLKYGADFLSNDLLSFKKARSEMNNDREPYKITKRNKNGEYITIYAPESVKLKEKYS